MTDILGKIERLRPFCEAVLLTAHGDSWTVCDLLHGAVGLHVIYNDGTNREIKGPSLAYVLDAAWDDRP